MEEEETNGTRQGRYRKARRGAKEESEFQGMVG
jgi:hypothetical protein